MKLDGGNVDVRSGAGVSNGKFLPLVRMTVSNDDGSEIVLHLTPIKARRIGLDLLSAATTSWADAGMRIYAKDHGLDGDGMVSQVTTLVKVALEEEG